MALASITCIPFPTFKPTHTSWYHLSPSRLVILNWSFYMCQVHATCPVYHAARAGMHSMSFMGTSIKGAATGR